LVCCTRRTLIRKNLFQERSCWHNQRMAFPQETATSDRYAPGWATGLLVIAGIVCLVIGVIYMAEPAKSLPSFFPGHTAGLAHHHAKHGIAALILGLALLALGWISTGSRSRTVA
jgi:hypothetical protein